MLYAVWRVYTDIAKAVEYTKYCESGFWLPVLNFFLVQHGTFPFQNSSFSKVAKLKLQNNRHYLLPELKEGFNFDKPMCSPSMNDSPTVSETVQSPSNQTNCA